MEYSIRPPMACEQQAWQALWHQYLDFYSAPSFAYQHTDVLWQRIQDSADVIQCQVAANEGGLVGLVHFLPHANTWYAAPVCYLQDLFVAPSMRRMGLGERLIEAVVAEAKAKGWANVYWQTKHDNQSARKLYDKLTGGTDGFVTYRQRF